MEFQQAHSIYEGAAEGCPLIFLMCLLEFHILQVFYTFDGLCGKRVCLQAHPKMHDVPTFDGLTSWPSTSPEVQKLLFLRVGIQNAENRMGDSIFRVPGP